MFTIKKNSQLRVPIINACTYTTLHKNSFHIHRGQRKNFLNSICIKWTSDLFIISGVVDNK